MVVAAFTWSQVPAGSTKSDGARRTCRKQASKSSFNSAEMVLGSGGGVPQEAMWYMRALALSNFNAFHGGAPVAI